MKEKLLEMLIEIRPDVAFEKETKLFDDGILDSFDIISIVQGMYDAFDVEVNVDALAPVNFNTVDAMVELIKKLQSED